MRVPSDLEILSAIYEAYYNEFANYDKNKPIRQSKILVPISCKFIGEKLNVDSDIVFGRLYYHLEKQHGYKRSDESRVYFFANRVGEEIHCINFPYMASALGQLKYENRKFLITSWMSGVALVLSAFAVALSYFNVVN